MNCAKCGTPGALRVGLRWRCGNPACRRYDSRLAGVDAERPAIRDVFEREQVATGLTPPSWLRWLSGILFLLPALGGIYGWWKVRGLGLTALMGSALFGIVGIMILFGGRAGARIARETVAQRRLREDKNSGCAFGLVLGIGAFAVFSLVIGPILTRWTKTLLGLPLQDWPILLLGAVGVLASWWGTRHARERREAGLDNRL